MNWKIIEKAILRARTSKSQARKSLSRTVPLFSPEDADLAELKWHQSRGYAVRGFPGMGQWRAHRIVITRMLGRQLGVGEVTDHINHDPLDNRRENLRVTDQFGNMQNRKNPLRGTYFIERLGKWYAQVTHRRKQHRCGYHQTREEAVRALAVKRKKLNLLGS